MKKISYLAAVLLILGLSGKTFAETAAVPAKPAVSTEAAAPAPAPVIDPGTEALKKGRKLSERGDLLKARKHYEQALENSKISGSSRESIREAYEKVNFELIFSKHETPESVIHTVEPGDNLYVIARKYGTTIALIKKINGLTKDVIHPKQKLKVIKVPFSIHVDKSENRMVVSLGDVPVKTYRVATGRENNTPVGTFKIINKLENPTWYKTGAVVPPDSPDNELGTRWLGFDLDSYGIHGTIHPESIGHQATSGCVRMLNEEVEELFAMVPLKTVVTIVD